MAMNRAKYTALPPDLRKVIDNNSGMATSAWPGRVQQANDPLGRKLLDTARALIDKHGKSTPAPKA